MGTSTSPAFDVEALRRGTEEANAATLTSLYADDAEIRVVDRNTQPSHPKVLHGRDAIAAMYDDVCSREMTHKVEQCLVQGDQVALTESCEYPDGVRVWASSMISLRDGKIIDHTLVQAWDD
ncbi:nuclear transport factor 2 family protein [Streptomyces scabiei]|uniref:SnoaL-like domain protein n=1 Tax=Streptomyces scabiei TaxID=1930 RepID=A0A100JIV8_STRSC|nr:nuclear transport factor 2 family protein [Streptomyces scabiei]GAQ60252.1 SnoaL-like domain protein [Streptomyces scabiei]